MVVFTCFTKFELFILGFIFKNFIVFFYYYVIYGFSCLYCDILI